MYKLLLEIVTSVATFVLGIAAWMLFSYPAGPGPVTEPEVVVTQFGCWPIIDCKTPVGFPGRSRPIAGLRRQKKAHFPAGTFDGWQDSDRLVNKWYSRHLRAMGERSIWEIVGDGEEVFRFTWLRTFDHPVVVRFSRKGYTFEIYSRELTGAGGYEPGRILRTDTKRLSKDEWCEFKRLLDETSYWQMPSVDDEGGGLDGAQWILEGVRNGQYHLVDRWSPESGAFREACVYLLQLSGRDTAAMGSDLY